MESDVSTSSGLVFPVRVLTKVCNFGFCLLFVNLFQREELFDYNQRAQALIGKSASPNLSESKENYGKNQKKTEGMIELTVKYYHTMLVSAGII